MCGFAGLISFSSWRSKDDFRSGLMAMTHALEHRGPDAHGFWIDHAVALGMGHRRLAVIDLTEGGQQPMVSSDGRYVLVFNGEIYNYLQIKKDLQKGQADLVAWRGTSDTEVLLEAISRWGLEAALKTAVGMFALAVWDRQKKTLSLARDRAGEKPLYYGYSGRTFLFGSELKAFMNMPGWEGTVSRESIRVYAGIGYIPAPSTIFTGVFKLPPGSFVSLPIDLLKATSGSTPSTPPFNVQTYWSFTDIVNQGKLAPFPGSLDEATDQLEELLTDSIRGQMIADVPLGAFLSGGVDSTTVVAIMQSLADKPVKTFTVGYEESDFNEAIHARAVARHLGTEHAEITVTSDDALKVIPDLPTLYDEPFADSSQIPTYLVSQFARESVTVSLSGDGGDELFGGYNRYFLVQQLWRTFGWMPADVRRLLSQALRRLPGALLSGSGTPGVLSRKYRQKGQIGDKLIKLSSVLGAPSAEAINSSLTSGWTESNILLGPEIDFNVKANSEPPSAKLALFEHMMFQDTTRYLPDDILVKVDRAAMAVSLETRIPLLDHRIQEFAWSVPVAQRVGGDPPGKKLLRQVLYRYVPEKLMNHPKTGFHVPLNSWLRGPLRDWAEHLLDEKRLKEQGVFNPAIVRSKWHENLTGARDWKTTIWALLMFQAWESYWKEPAPLHKANLLVPEKVGVEVETVSFNNSFN